MLLHLLKISVLGQIFREVIVRAESVQICEDDISFCVSGILDAKVRGIREHLAVDLFFDSLGSIAEINAVSERFAHLGLAVYAGKSALGLILRDHGSGHDKGLAICVIELLHDLPGLFEHRQLVLSYRNDRRVKCCDIRRLGDGVSKEAGRESLVREAAHLHLRLNSGVAGETGCRNKVHVIESQRVKSRQRGLNADRCLFWVNSHRQIIQDHIDDIVPDLAGVVGVVGQCLVIGDQNVDLIIFTGVLKFNAALQGADIMAEVKASRGAVTCKDNLFLCFVHQYMFLSVYVFYS